MNKNQKKEGRELELVLETKEIARKYVDLSLMLESAEYEIPFKGYGWKAIKDLFEVRGELEAAQKVQEILEIREDRFEKEWKASAEIL